MPSGASCTVQDFQRNTCVPVLAYVQGSLDRIAIQRFFFWNSRDVFPATSFDTRVSFLESSQTDTLKAVVFSAFSLATSHIRFSSNRLACSGFHALGCFAFYRRSLL